MPFSTPDVAETRKRPATTTMIATATPFDFGTSRRYSSPLLSWSPLSPRAVAVPKSVATIARASTTRPNGVSWTFGPSSGENVELTSVGSPLRKLK
jgi:hypothetical protein